MRSSIPPAVNLQKDDKDCKSYKEQYNLQKDYKAESKEKILCTYPDVSDCQGREKIDKDLFRLVESKDGHHEEELTLLPGIDTMITEQAVVIKSPPP